MRKLYSRMTLKEFCFKCKKHVFAEYTWKDVRNNIKGMLLSSTKSELDFYYNSCMTGIGVLIGYFAYDAKNAEIFNYTLDLRSRITDIDIKKIKELSRI